ncbi:interleukin 17 receptor A1a [Aplochiton taeniatus]
MNVNPFIIKWHHPFLTNRTQQMRASCSMASQPGLVISAESPGYPANTESHENDGSQAWSFSSDQVIVEPGHMYKVTVYNLPKPNIGHTSYDESKEITVPDCSDHVVRQSTFCQQTGGLWEPNITLEHVAGTSMLHVGFNIEQFSENYTVDVSCAGKNKQFKDKAKLCYFQNNQTSLNLTFDLEEWPRTCCKFYVQITPYFRLCQNDCVRRQKKFNICPALPEPETPATPVVYSIIGITTGVILVCFVCCVTCALRKHKRVPQGDPLLPTVGGPQDPSFPERPPKVMIIYSKDHRLYNDIVLNLCAFLRAKCGTEVVVDLLDSAWLGTVGRMRWLEWQRHQLKNPSDKILVLCSPGVQAKWKAMCGLDQVLLREDVLSPNDDILIPFLNLFLPDMHQAASLGKYMVAYFDDVSSEHDVPSVFHIGVKYKLMKHFEELYFRILDIEKYQPRQISHIEEIGPDEYFKCPAGRALREAIETFQAYQLEHPNWFREECVDDVEEVISEHNSTLNFLLKQAPPVLECVPIYNEAVPMTENWLHLEGDPDMAQGPVENEEEEPDSFLYPIQPSPRTLHRRIALKDSLSSSVVMPSVAEEDECQTLPSAVVKAEVEMGAQVQHHQLVVQQ